ncbi:hypothetical protein GBAR_LOCUS10522 [Geodia barretti]|uniref:Uncharacterized protein n=1 Tax=Geodia barretti TaxID=519541 RepID=A0AA35WDF5_GEOBA|nr:hypothetical protein GBAR_LOCUS10522 [Geodia barretti]
MMIAFYFRVTKVIKKWTNTGRGVTK